MAAIVPSAPEYPVLTELGTGSPLDFIELERLAHIVNWSIAHIGAETLASQSWHPPEGDIGVAGLGVVAQWRIPTVAPQFCRLRVEIDAECDGGSNASVTFQAGLGNSVTIPITSLRLFRYAVLPIDSTAGFATVSLRDVDPDGGTLRIWGVQLRFAPLTSPLDPEDDPTAWPLGLELAPLASTDQPLSAALGVLLVDTLQALLERPRALFNCSGWREGRLRSHGDMDQLPQAVAHLWPGQVAAGRTHRVHVRVEPHASETTWFRLLGRGFEDDGEPFEQVLLEVEVDPGAWTVWFGPLDVEIPDRLFHRLNDARQAVLLYWEGTDTIGDEINSTGTNCGVLSLLVEGP